MSKHEIKAAIIFGVLFSINMGIDYFSGGEYHPVMNFILAALFASLHYKKDTRIVESE